MKYLVATTETQGQRANDFSFVPEGEVVVRMGGECDREEVDGECGCRRAMSGSKTLMATTTFRVVEDEAMTRLDLFDIAYKALEAGGWLAFVTPARAFQWAAEVSAANWEVAERFPAGAIIERRGSRFVQRVPKAA